MVSLIRFCFRLVNRLHFVLVKKFQGGRNRQYVVESIFSFRLIDFILLDFRQCFQLFAPQGFVDTPDKLCFIMRSLSMAPTIAELKRYFAKYKKGLTKRKLIKIDLK